MQDLHLIGVHEDGEHLLLGDGSGGEFRLRLDDALRRAARHEPNPAAVAPGQAPATHGPREVQAMIRAGASSEEAAERAGWTLDKVHRFDGPILAERGHIAARAAQTRLRGRYGETGATLAERVLDRLHARGVPAQSLTWDAWRTEDGHWTVVARFSAGGRAREATWSYLRHSGTVQALDDEALWLAAEEEPESPIPRRQVRPESGRREHGHPEHGHQEHGHLEHGHGDQAPGGHGSEGAHAPTAPVASPQAQQSRGAATHAATGESLGTPATTGATGTSGATRTTGSPSAGGRAAAVRRQGGSPTATDETDGEGRADIVAPERPGVPFEIEAHEDRFDLMDSVRQRSSAGRRRGGVVRRAHRVETTPGAPASPAALPPAAGVTGDAALPLADLGYDPDTMEPPPGAHSDPQPDGPDGRPEPAAAVAAQRPKPSRSRRTTKVAPPRNRPAGKLEPEPTMPARTKRRRPAAFPGALDADPETQLDAAVSVADLTVADDVVAVADTNAAPDLVAEDAAATDVAARPNDPEPAESVANADAPPVVVDEAPAVAAAATDATPVVDVNEADDAPADEADIDEDERIVAGSAEGPTIGEDQAAQPGPAVDDRPSVASDTVDEPQLPWGEDPSGASTGEGTPPPAPADDKRAPAPTHAHGAHGADDAGGASEAVALAAGVSASDAVTATDGRASEEPERSADPPEAADPDAAIDQDATTLVDDKPSAAAPAESAAEPASEPVIPKPAPPPGNRRGRPKGRASVPSWDDIMFGSRRD